MCVCVCCLHAPRRRIHPPVRAGEELTTAIDHLTPTYYFPPGASRGKEMVYYFTSTATQPAATVYVGKDKYESQQITRHPQHSPCMGNHSRLTGSTYRRGPHQVWLGRGCLVSFIGQG